MHGRSGHASLRGEGWAKCKGGAAGGDKIGIPAKAGIELPRSVFQPGCRKQSGRHAEVLKKRAKERIDGAVALAMAVGLTARTSAQSEIKLDPALVLIVTT